MTARYSMMYLYCVRNRLKVFNIHQKYTAKIGETRIVHCRCGGAVYQPQFLYAVLPFQPYRTTEIIIHPHNITASSSSIAPILNTYTKTLRSLTSSASNHGLPRTEEAPEAAFRAVALAARQTERNICCEYRQSASRRAQADLCSFSLAHLLVCHAAQSRNISRSLMLRRSTQATRLHAAGRFPP